MKSLMGYKIYKYETPVYSGYLNFQNLIYFVYWGNTGVC